MSAVNIHQSTTRCNWQTLDQHHITKNHRYSSLTPNRQWHNKKTVAQLKDGNGTPTRECTVAQQQETVLWQHTKLIMAQQPETVKPQQEDCDTPPNKTVVHHQVNKKTVAQLQVDNSTPTIVCTVAQQQEIVLWHTTKLIMAQQQESVIPQRKDCDTPPNKLWSNTKWAIA